MRFSPRGTRKSFLVFINKYMYVYTSIPMNFGIDYRRNLLLILSDKYQIPTYISLS